MKLSDKGSAEQRANLLNQSEGKKDRLRDGLEDTNNNSNEREIEIEDDVNESDLQNYAEEIQHLFPKYAVRERAGVREIQLDNTADKDQANSPRKPQENSQEQPPKEKKIKKRSGL